MLTLPSIIISDVIVQRRTSTLVPDTRFTNQPSTVWSDPTPDSPSAKLLKFGLQPASVDALERAGLTSNVGRYTLFALPIDLTPEDEVVITGSAQWFTLPSGTTFLVNNVDPWGVYTEALLERIS